MQQGTCQTRIPVLWRETEQHQNEENVQQCSGLGRKIKQGRERQAVLGDGSHLSWRGSLSRGHLKVREWDERPGIEQ